MGKRSHGRTPTLAVLMMVLGAPTRVPAHSPSSPSPFPADITFVDATERLGLPLLSGSRATFVDFNADHCPDIVIRNTYPGQDRPDAFRVFIHDGRGRYREVSHPRLPSLHSAAGGEVVTFADLDNDGISDALFARPPVSTTSTTRPASAEPTLAPGAYWLKGAGDGTFGPPIALTHPSSPPHTAAIAVGDLNSDGRPDIVLGNWYDAYGKSLTADPTELLMQQPDGTFCKVRLPEEGIAFDGATDAGPRPTYGVAIARIEELSQAPVILQLNYGRRANRLYAARSTTGLDFRDIAPEIGFDGDAIRDGKYPQWLKERGKTDSRFDREDEKPFRSHGNTFDVAVGDINGDGRFDLFVTEITHAWAGPSSDRSRFLVMQNGIFPKFVSPPSLDVNREGTTEENRSWNQGDIFARLADLNNDGRLDLVLASSDYPDPPPHENKLRIYLQQADGSLKETDFGIHHLGAGMISLADVDGDGDLDLLVGQSFNRLPASLTSTMPDGPVVRLYLNQTAERKGPKSIQLDLQGDPTTDVTKDAFNTIVQVTTRSGEVTHTQVRQLMGPGGHAGKAGDLGIHIGLGEATEAEEIRIRWPGLGGKVAPSVLKGVKPGRYTVTLKGNQREAMQSSGNTVSAAPNEKDFVAGNMLELNDNGAWSWFMDERLIVHNGKLLVGSIRSTPKHDYQNADDPNWGNCELAVYDIESGKNTVVILHPHFEQDDHNGPALLVRPDGKVVAVYTKHSQERKVYWRVSSNSDLTEWTPIKELVTPGKDQPPFGGDNVTYSNLFQPANASGRMFNFFRSLFHQQNWMYSDDQGDSWTYGGMFLKGHQGYAPYFKYTTNGVDKIHFIGTEDHPRNFDNSVYHGFIQIDKGKDLMIHHSDGRLFGPLSKTSDKSGDIWDLTVVYRGDADHVAWVHDLHLDANQNPVCTFSVQRDGKGLPKGQGGMDHRYHYARWDGLQWIQHEIAYAGTRLYKDEDDYTGGICLDPRDVTQVYISTDAHPTTGEPLISSADGKRHYEIFHGKISDQGKTWVWTPLTANSTTDNLRPLVPDWKDPRVAVVWMRGKYEHNRGPWSTKVVGLIRARP